MLADYFKDINAARCLDYPNYFKLTSHSSGYIACAFGLRKRHKEEVVELARRHYNMPSLKSGNFSFHHIIDRPQLSDISAVGPKIDHEYDIMPAIMLHNEMHGRFHSSISILETRKLSLGQEEGILKKAVDSEKITRKMFKNDPAEARKIIEKRIDTLIELYADAFSWDYIVKTIARNILNEYRNRLRSY